MKDTKSAFGLCQSAAHSHRPEWHRRTLQSLSSPRGTSASLTASNPRDEGTEELIICMFVGFVLVNFLHLWKLIIHRSGSKDDDVDDGDGDTKTAFTCQVLCVPCICLSPLNGLSYLIFTAQWSRYCCYVHYPRWGKRVTVYVRLWS